MEKENLILEKSKFAYKSAARSLILVTTISLIFYLSLFKFISNPNSTKVVTLNKLIPSMERMIEQMHVDNSISAIDPKVINDILGWGFVSQYGSINRESCDSSGCFYYLFFQDDDQISVSDLLKRFQNSLQILGRENNLNDVDLKNIFFSNFLSRANSKDSAILAMRYYNIHCTDSVNEIIRRHFTLINFQRQLNYSTILENPDSITKKWLSILDPLNQLWTNNKDSMSNIDTTVFSINNLKKMRDRFINIDNVELGSSLKIKGEDSYLITHWLVLFIVFSTWWFWWKARIMEFFYNKINNKYPLNFTLSSLSSGFFHLIESNTFTKLFPGVNYRSMKSLFLMVWCTISAIIEFILLVLLPSFTALVVPLFVQSLISNHLFNRSLVYYIVYALILLFTIDIFISIHFPKWLNRTYKFRSILFNDNECIQS